MRPCSAALAGYLNSAANLEIVQVDLYTFALSSGEMLRWSGGDAALTIPAAGFPAGSINHGAPQTFTLGPRFGRSKVTNKIGVQAAELDIEIMAGANDLIGTFAIAEAVRLGIFDGATVELDRLFAPPQAAGAGALDTSLGCLLWFYGRVADCDIGRSTVQVKVKSLMNLLAVQQMPRRLYGAACTHIFGDAMCGYDRAGGKNAQGAVTGVGQITVTAATGSTQSLVNITSSPAAAYVEGTITGATGANTGSTRTVANLGGGAQVAVWRPLLFPITPGDTFTMLPGCDHTTATCNGTFNNLLRYGGMPYIPPPEQAV
ncbi:MAG TPA: DUF2163 domain-containing protein [Stellaceae bacterium]|nr:DUF2163 domain-containing protein [Stellaceae bacterium]